jgi:hypothetical protein
MANSNKVELVRIRGETSILIDAEITDEGDLVFMGQDIGAAAREAFGDHEYWLRIPAAEKDRALLAVLEKYLGGNAMLISELRSCLESKGVACQFFSH